MLASNRADVASTFVVSTVPAVDVFTAKVSFRLAMRVLRRTDYRRTDYRRTDYRRTDYGIPAGRNGAMQHRPDWKS
jgi:hypothetical protein